MLPEDELAKAAKSSLSKACKIRNRKKACDDVPELAEALANGATTGDRVDMLAKVTAGLKPEELDKVAVHGASIAAAAATGSDRQYRETIERIVSRARDDDGLDRLAQQRRATRLRWWTSADGMWNLAGKFDTVRGTELEGRLRNTIEALVQGAVADEAPADPIERHDFFAALALIAICEGKAPTSGVPDVTVLIDATTLVDGRRHEDTILDVGLGRFGLPVETVRRWACLGTVTPVVVGADGVRLFLGRETRLANRAQRRALRVLYRTCALCDTPFEHTQVHHVSWYGLQHGLTDIDNLAAVVHQTSPSRPRRRLAALHLHPTARSPSPDQADHITSHDPPRARAA